MVVDTQLLVDAGVAVGSVGGISFGVAVLRKLWKVYLVDALGAGPSEQPYFDPDTLKRGGMGPSHDNHF